MKILAGGPGAGVVRDFGENVHGGPGSRGKGVRVPGVGQEDSILGEIFTSRTRGGRT